ncbi:MAG: glycosyltransferase [Rickettsiales bacterium]|jgi:glycosyltransferase involved in cell wall biosynthesis|nr:glycosyltransferase [Rickettsiales bacterium]
MNSLISVIIPVCNTEEYLAECLNSILGQTHKNLEIIAVDDFSSDGSLKILEEFSAKDERIKIISLEKNLGQGAARNVGLRAAAGKFVCFVDSDDFIDADYIEKLLVSMAANRTDMICSNRVLKYYPLNPKKNNFMRKAKDFPLGQKIIGNDVQKFFKKMLISPCCKLYALDFLKQNNIFFAEGANFEDFYFFHILRTKINSLSFVYNSVYYYRQRKNSTMSVHKKLGNNSFDSLEIVKKICENFKNNNILDKYSAPILWLNKFFKKHTEKSRFFFAVKDFLFSICEDVQKNSAIYDRKSLAFLRHVLNSNSYLSFRIKFMFWRLLG